MSARDDILERVRRATAGVAPAPRPDPVPGRSAGSASSHAAGAVEQGEVDWVALFCERVADYRASVERCRASEAVDRVFAAVAGLRVVVPDGLSVEVAGGVRDEGLTALELDDLDGVVTDCAVAIAETGTIVLDHGSGQGRRALSLVPDHHVCLVRAEQVVPDVPDAVARLHHAVRTGRPLTWISGPSATSDIELTRVEGVHGPRHLHVIVLD